MILADASGIFITNLASNPRYFFTMTLIVVFSICFHEFCHAQTALWMGDDTAASRGHLTLNPLKQMGVISIIMFLVLGFAWGAVPVDPRKLRSKYRWGELAVSLAGPAANLLLFAIGWTAFGLCCLWEVRPRILEFLFLAGLMNFVLFLFNLLPVPGLDGWNAFRFLFPRVPIPNSEVMRGILVFLIFGALFGVTYLFRAGEWVMRQAPEVFAGNAFPADAARRASLADALPGMHRTFWNSGPLEAKRLAAEDAKPGLLTTLASADREDKQAMPMSHAALAVSGEYGDDGFALFAGARAGDPWLGYRLKRIRGLWCFRAIENPDETAIAWEKRRLETPMPQHVPDPEETVRRLAPKLFSVHTPEEYRALLTGFVPAARFRLSQVPENELRLEPPAATCYFRRITGRKDFYGGRDTVVAAELLFCSEPLPGSFLSRTVRPVSIHLAYHDGAGWLIDPDPPAADAR